MIVDPAEREKMIYEQVRKIEEDIWGKKYKAVIGEKLLNDVVDLVEIPHVIKGSFPKEFLYMPADILMEYFPPETSLL